MDVRAPDGTEIRLLIHLGRGSMVHCTLRAGQVSQAVRHRTVEELWYCLAGAGELWRGEGDREEIVELTPGTALSIPTGTDFQFRTISTHPLEVVITTMPPWPGADEAVIVEGRWRPTSHA
jgi:mannose-6-phosphate isomerase-like protein (cupin superfamily)